LARLVGARRFGVKLGLDRMEGLLARLGRPDERLGLVLHVGGTNGKGSVVAMIAALARAAGKRVATYTSPHLATLRERVTIDGELATEAQIVAAAAAVSAAGGDELTFFEQITAIAMLIIAGARPDVTVLEVGLGGRLDATNVVAAPIAVVTGVAMDHEAILGDTLEAIAKEKAGIFKPGQRVIVGISGEPAAVPWLAERARAVGASVEVIERPAQVALSLPGAHQQRNAAAALAAVRAAGLPVHEDALRHVVHPGRFERAGELILDGAHNPHGARALAEALGDERPVLVLAVSADKDVRAIVRELAPAVRAIVATRYQQDRALDPEALAAIVREFASDVRVAPDLRSAVELARTIGTPIAIAGSLFIVGEARVAYLGAPSDPVRVSDPPATSS
ncbi:MAG TPA: Mur ligase family protein, partial [Kofleriaceae bacterium]